MSYSVSVAMTTYNGEKFILKQLESILYQTKTPDEVIISDDGSTDRTVSIIENFIREKELTNWSIRQNTPGLGWKANFFNTAALTKGDVVFFSDQDDIWDRNKIEDMSGLMIQYKMGALYGEKIIIDSCDEIVKERQDKRRYTGELYRVPLTPSFYNIKTLGCCMCISREVANIYKEMNFYEGDHDSQSGRLAILFSSLWHLDKPVIKYRIHQGNTSGVSEVASFGQSTRESRILEIELSIKWLRIVLRNADLTQQKKAMLEGCIKFLRKRLGFFNNRVSPFYLITHMKYYTGPLMLLGDFAYKYGLNKKLGLIWWKINKIFQ